MGLGCCQRPYEWSSVLTVTSNMICEHLVHTRVQASDRSFSSQRTLYVILFDSLVLRAAGPSTQWLAWRALSSSGCCLVKPQGKAQCFLLREACVHRPPRAAILTSALLTVSSADLFAGLFTRHDISYDIHTINQIQTTRFVSSQCANVSLSV